MPMVQDIDGWMRFWGWTLKGWPGSVKLDHTGKTIAKHGDDVWKADVAEAERLQSLER